ncbi:hypothetical protein BDV38DRAFT_252265 [Aspergillus pseudotamarii]|uniref:Uncharacterized protein n=1 Tax=Aspergillus pseudotamarii TaxID=132259 RepID=A0A5N6SND3_ASPPS|nr:uncharacterized protein BDV38DRAFT_252265 [Aspergillus pseudotamarii]KAE8135417.1 hypothetical protein BDV38DRAFT_252265 [Aspergillus pseudotamarii]
MSDLLDPVTSFFFFSFFIAFISIVIIMVYIPKSIVCLHVNRLLFSNRKHFRLRYT